MVIESVYILTIVKLIFCVDIQLSPGSRVHISMVILKYYDMLQSTIATATESRVHISVVTMLNTISMAKLATKIVS